MVRTLCNKTCSRRACILTMLQVLPYHCYSLRDGGHECYVTQSEIALGRGYEQAFHRRRDNVPALQLQAAAGRRASGLIGCALNLYRVCFDRLSSATVLNETHGRMLDSSRVNMKMKPKLSRIALAQRLPEAAYMKIYLQSQPRRTLCSALLILVSRNSTPGYCTLSESIFSPEVCNNGTNRAVKTLPSQPLTTNSKPSTSPTRHFQRQLVLSAKYDICSAAAGVRLN